VRAPAAEAPRWGRERQHRAGSILRGPRAARPRVQPEGVERRAPPPEDPGELPETALKAVREQLLALRQRDEADRRTLLKRLLVKWHPDRNPESTELATAVFQCIQQERQQLGL